jgi:hypothetical protein
MNVISAPVVLIPPLLVFYVVSLWIARSLAVSVWLPFCLFTASFLFAVRVYNARRGRHKL